MDANYRIEKDSMGEIEVPKSSLYGAQTQRALNNFIISSEPMPVQFIRAVLQIKKGAATANHILGLLQEDEADAIVISIDQLTEEDLRTHFPVPVLQTGSGTSTNMNVNEVISSLAKIRGVVLSPNDHVNMGQSSNDVIPSALHISTAIQTKEETIPALADLASAIRATAETHRDIIKTGRTHLMDALPIRLSCELEAWASQIDDCIARLETVLTRLQRIPLGGTAVGSGVNCHPGFVKKILPILNSMSGLTLRSMDSVYKGLSSIDSPLELSGHLKTAACVLMKISNDLRLMNSGPISGIGEIILPSLQPGSSIMPDKVNPVIPESVCMAAAQVMGNDTTITIAAQSGNFQLNTMFPLAASKLLESGSLISGSARALATKAINQIKINRAQIAELLGRNPVLVTALAPYIGYIKASHLAKKARTENRSIFEVALEETDISREDLQVLLDPASLADGGRAPALGKTKEPG